MYLLGWGDTKNLLESRADSVCTQTLRDGSKDERRGARDNLRCRFD
jgi:hypothetical protein